MDRATILQFLSPATSPAGSGHKTRAVLVCLAAAVGTILLMPSAGAAWPQIPAFVPVYQTAVIFAYAVTAYLLWGHFLASGASALLFLGGGCLYTALVLLAQLLSFPGLFGPAGLVSGGGQTTIWLWAFWHMGPPAFLLAYAVFEWRFPGHRVATAGVRAVGRGALAAVLALAALTLGLVTLGHDWLTPLNRGNDFSLMTSSGVAPAIQALTIVALLVHWRVSRLKMVLHVWMAVALFVLLLDNAITMMGASRFTVGWYVGRFNALLSAFVLLSVYLREIRALYARLAAAALASADQNLVLEERVLARTAALAAALEETERARAQAEKAAADRSAFLSSASHDLRQPFQAMRLYHGMLAERVADDVGTRMIQGLHVAMSAGEELLAALLNVSTFDAGLVRPAPARVSADALLGEVAEECGPVADDRGMTLRVRAAAELWMDTDPVLLKRAVRNLVLNSIRYSKPGGHVLLAGRAGAGHVLIQVWDDGIGIPEDKYEAVFEDFVQLGNPERDRAKGLGLGLSIVRRTAALLGFKVGLRSNLGRGSVFSLWLPRVPAPLPSTVVPIGHTSREAGEGAAEPGAAKFPA